MFKTEAVDFINIHTIHKFLHFAWASRTVLFTLYRNELNYIRPAINVYFLSCHNSYIYDFFKVPVVMNKQIMVNRYPTLIIRFVRVPTELFITRGAKILGVRSPWRLNLV
jgi:hypothetical protein